VLSEKDLESDGVTKEGCMIKLCFMRACISEAMDTAFCILHLYPRDMPENSLHFHLRQGL
jgi:hypothetical protein